MNPYDPDPLDSAFMFENEREMYERLRAVEAHRIRAARLAGVALMGGSAAVVIVVALLVWRWLA